MSATGVFPGGVGGSRGSPALNVARAGRPRPREGTSAGVHMGLGSYDWLT